jgi:hypothetical protein
VATAGHVPHVG